MNHPLFLIYRLSEKAAIIRHKNKATIIHDQKPSPILDAFCAPSLCAISASRLKKLGKIISNKTIKKQINKLLNEM